MANTLYSGEILSLVICKQDTVRSQVTTRQLANRGNFKHRMLIGRYYLKDAYLVNSNSRCTTESSCKGETLVFNEQS